MAELQPRFGCMRDGLPMGRFVGGLGVRLINGRYPFEMREESMKLVFGIEKRHIAAFALLLVCLASLSLGKTTDTGGISGTVTDPSGAMVGGAKLTLKSVATGETTTTTSSATGDFQLPLLKPGDYTLIVSRDNFKSLTRTVTVLLGQNSTLNLALDLCTPPTLPDVPSYPPFLH